MSNDGKGFLTIKRRDPGYRPKEQRLKDYRAVERRFTDDEVREQALRCMDCGTPFCHGCGCPLLNVIPEFNEFVQAGRWREALDILLSTNVFPEFTGRICPALCEGSCVLGINDEPTAIRQIELAVIEKGFELGFVSPRPPAERRSQRVAVIGSGPAGLAVAEVLNKLGFRVVVYESHAKAGGILQYSIPDFKLEKWVLDRRLHLMEAEGVVFETGVVVGRDISHNYLRQRFEAIILTGGAREPRDIKVAGRDLKGIHFAMEFLIQQNMRNGGEKVDPASSITAAGKSVVVIGGGDTGSDCVGTSLRQGAKQVRQFEILPKPPVTRASGNPWPLWPMILRESSSHKEGGERRWCVNTKAFIGENGSVKSMRCVEVDWNGPDGKPLKGPVEKPGSEFVVEADLVLLAMGFVGPGRNQLVEELGLELDSRGFIKRDVNRMTSQKGIFVARDMTAGASLVVRAMGDGMETAKKVAAFLDQEAGR